MLSLEKLARELVEQLKAGNAAPELYKELDARLEEIAKEREDFAGLVDQARDIHCTDDLEIDDEPLFSAADTGVWVQAWAWVPFAEEEEGEEEADFEDAELAS